MSQLATKFQNCCQVAGESHTLTRYNVSSQVGRKGCREAGRQASNKIGYLNMQRWCTTNVRSYLHMSVPILNQYLLVHLDSLGRRLKCLLSTYSCPSFSSSSSWLLSICKSTSGPSCVSSISSSTSWAGGGLSCDSSTRSVCSQYNGPTYLHPY